MEEIKKKEAQQRIEETFKELEVLFDTAPNFTDPTMHLTHAKANGTNWINLNDSHDMETLELW